MSETIERLDYTKAPPGYNIVSDVDGYLFRDKGGNMYRSAGHHLGGDWRKDVALVKAWSHYKREHDPPGMMVEEVESVRAAILLLGLPIAMLDELEAPEIDGWGFTIGNQQWSADWNKVEARAAAWAWHDRRLALAARLARGFTIVTGPTTSAFVQVWPGCLAWTDEQAAEVECHMQAENDAANQGRDSGSRWPAVLPQPYDSEGGALIEAHARDKAAQERYADS